METDKIRLNKYIAECGVCSRREADKLIEHGKITVNGQMAENGMQISEGDLVQYAGKTLSLKDKKIVLAYYKPIGVTCTEKDRFAKKTIIDAVDFKERVTYAGRLDKDSEGLILLTNDGDLINQMMRGANKHEKEYLVKVNKPITEQFVEKMSQGVYLKELSKTTRECVTEQTGKMTFRIVLTQGLNRQIRRMCKELGYEVKAIKRIRVMNIELADIKYGTYREITDEEKKKLYEMAGIK